MDGTSLTPPSSGRSTPTRTHGALPSNEAVGLRCKHCCLTKPVTSITDLARSMPHQYYSHFKKCPMVPAALMEKLEAVKVLQGIQKSQSITSLPEYCRQIIGMYGLVDLEWNGVGSGVAFCGDRAGIKNVLGSDKMLKSIEGRDSRNGTQQETFALPFLVKSYANPVTSDLVEIAQGDDERKSDSSDRPLVVKLPPSVNSESRPRLEPPTEDASLCQMFTSSPISSEKSVYSQVFDCLWKGAQ